MTGFISSTPRETFEILARKSLENLPAPFREKLGDVVVKVEEFATAEQLAAVGLTNKWELSGLYEGRPLPDKSI